MRILETLSWADIEKVMSALPIGSPTMAAKGASIDTRTLEEGDIFFALKGERTDGHDHIQSALERGASCVVIKDRAHAAPGSFSLLVNDPEASLFELARLIRSKSS